MCLSGLYFCLIQWLSTCVFIGTVFLFDSVAQYLCLSGLYFCLSQVILASVASYNPIYILNNTLYLHRLYNIINDQLML